MRNSTPHRWLLLYVAPLFLALVAFSPPSHAATMVNGVLMVNGKPFFPLGSGLAGATIPDVERLGLNVAFRSVPSSVKGIAEYRRWMRKANRRGIQVVPFLSYGGGGTHWPMRETKRVAKLGSEPNCLAWDLGDGLGYADLPAMQRTVDTLRSIAPNIPVVADYGDAQTAEVKDIYHRYVNVYLDIAYPIPNVSISQYMSGYDERRAFYGKPMWMWLQLFMWDFTREKTSLGTEGGPGPVPDPSQVRLIAFGAINRGVRGFLFFPHTAVHYQQELAGAVAQVCREIRLVSEPLAGGRATYNLATSDSTVNATAFTYNGSVVVSAMVIKPTYSRWVDRALVHDVTIDVPWSGSRMPTAHVILTPDLVQCPVRPGTKPGTIRVTVPSLEVADFVLVTTDSAQVRRVRKGLAKATDELANFAVPAAYVEARKASDAAWGAGICNTYSNDLAMSVEDTCDAVFRYCREKNYPAEMRAWRHADRMSRALLDSVMQFALAHRDAVPPEDRRFLELPYSVFQLTNLRNAPPPGDPWHFVRHYLVVGPYPLGWNVYTKPKIVPAGFDSAYPPQTSTDLNETFQTLDGPMRWESFSTDMAGMLDLLRSFKTTDNVVCYTRAVVVAPRDTTMTFSLGSNDGARVWVNGDLVFSWSAAPTGGRGAAPHQNEMQVKLHAGRNIVLTKVENLGKYWQLYESFKDPDRVLRYEQ